MHSVTCNHKYDTPTYILYLWGDDLVKLSVLLEYSFLLSFTDGWFFNRGWSQNLCSPCRRFTHTSISGSQQDQPTWQRWLVFTYGLRIGMSLSAMHLIVLSFLGFPAFCLLPKVNTTLLVHNSRMVCGHFEGLHLCHHGFSKLRDWNIW